MPSPRELRRRIRSITSTAQITRAMQMVASSKMFKAQQSTLMTRPFAQLMYRIQRHATTRAREFTHPLLEVREVRKRAVILVGTDKGLCGALNTNVFRVAAQFDPAAGKFDDLSVFDDDHVFFGNAHLHSQLSVLLQLTKFSMNGEEVFRPDHIDQ